MILSRAWLHDTVSCAAWNDARKGVYLKPLFKIPCSNCYWGWSKPIMLDYRDISLMESVPLLWRTVTASPVGIEPMTILEGPPPYNWYLIHNVEKSTFSTGWPPNTPYDCAEARRTQVADATFRDNSDKVVEEEKTINTGSVYWSNEAWMDRFCQLGLTGLVIFRWNQQASASAESRMINICIKQNDKLFNLSLSFLSCNFIHEPTCSNKFCGDIVINNRVPGK